jgi:hypothetical protein
VASHGWVIADSFGASIWRGAGPVDGIPSQLNPFRAELCGVLALLHLFLRLETHHNFHGISATIYCDNLKAVRGASNCSPINIKQANRDDYDIFVELKSLQRALQAPPIWNG